MMTMAALIPGAAMADGSPGSGGVNCPPGLPNCYVHVTGPGSGGGSQKSGGGSTGGGGGGAATCTMNPPSGDGSAQTVPCYRSDLGWFNSQDNCYWQRDDPQPAANDPAWNGHKPGDGALYNVSCTYNGGQINGGTTWAQNPPPGMGGGVNVAQLAQQAMKKLPLLPPQIDINPQPGGKGLVGMPVWMAVTRTAGDWGPQTASASAGGVTVTATGTVQQVVWSMGDGQSVTCTGPGTPYNPSYGKASSPDCGYSYAQDSSTQPGGKYTVSATATWDVRWAGAGQQGDITTSRTSTVQITITQLQVVN
ncbi:ATP/GTP-binding protein [Streptantibioticus ferralitis]